MTEFAYPPVGARSSTHPIAPAIGGIRNGRNGSVSVIAPIRASVRSLAQASKPPMSRARTALIATTNAVFPMILPMPG